MKFVFLCAHVYQMALKPGSEIEIEPNPVAVGERLGVGACKDCAENYGNDFDKDKYKVTIVPLKGNKPDPVRPD
jgi:hypothetical protein